MAAWTGCAAALQFPPIAFVRSAIPAAKLSNPAACSGSDVLRGIAQLGYAEGIVVERFSEGNKPLRTSPPGRHANVRITRCDFAPGATTGWHTHD